MAKVTEAQVTVTKVVVELDPEEAKGLQDLLWYGVGSNTLEELNLRSLSHTLHSYRHLRGSGRQFKETAQL